jgi:broad specificity phosphatase PhoE
MRLVERCGSRDGVCRQPSGGVRAYALAEQIEVIAAQLAERVGNQGISISADQPYATDLSRPLRSSLPVAFRIEGQSAACIPRSRNSSDNI